MRVPSFRNVCLAQKKQEILLLEACFEIRLAPWLASSNTEVAVVFAMGVGHWGQKVLLQPRAVALKASYRKRTQV